MMGSARRKLTSHFASGKYPDAGRCNADNEHELPVNEPFRVSDALPEFVSFLSQSEV
jgi:hypothetical protein